MASHSDTPPSPTLNVVQDEGSLRRHRAARSPGRAISARQSRSSPPRSSARTPSADAVTRPACASASRSRGPSSRSRRSAVRSRSSATARARRRSDPARLRPGRACQRSGRVRLRSGRGRWRTPRDCVIGRTTSSAQDLRQIRRALLRALASPAVRLARQQPRPPCLEGLSSSPFGPQKVRKRSENVQRHPSAANDITAGQPLWLTPFNVCHLRGSSSASTCSKTYRRRSAAYGSLTGHGGAHHAPSTARRVRSSLSGIRCPYVDSTRVAFSCPSRSATATTDFPAASNTHCVVAPESVAGGPGRESRALDRRTEDERAVVVVPIHSAGPRGEDGPVPGGRERRQVLREGIGDDRR